MTDLNKIESIIRFKRQLVSELPYAPNKKESKDYLLSLDIGEIVHIYDFWQQRRIHVHPRNTIVSSQIRNCALYLRNRERIKVILSRVSNGLDVNRYLSHKAHNATFEVEQFKQTHSFNSFRDQILICEGFHHLHLEEFPKRSDEVLIAHVTSSTFEVVQIASHDLFKSDAEALAEYEKHINAFVLAKNPNGGFIIGGAGGGMQNLAGSSIESSIKQITVSKILQNVEIANTGIEKYVKNLYQHCYNRNPHHINPEWRMLGREIAIYDKKNRVQFEGNNLLHRFV
ncbi:MAG: hypothetical protein PHP57_12430 [Sideroxydans sp.]|nr:hypothetical protein [Sideroxydans sp.]